MHTNKKACASDSYYHVESGSLGSTIFSKAADYKELYAQIQSILSKDNPVEIAAYCILPDRFCFLLCETRTGGVGDFLSQLTEKFNNSFKESLLSNNQYVINNIDKTDIADCSCKIHRNAINWKNCEHSSVRAFLYGDKPDWLKTQHVKDLCGSSVEYYRLLRRPINRKIRSIIGLAVKKHKA